MKGRLKFKFYEGGTASPHSMRILGSNCQHFSSKIQIKDLEICH
jgi:hypothetical protein